MKGGGEQEERRREARRGKAKTRFTLGEQRPMRVGEGETHCSRTVPVPVPRGSMQCLSLRSSLPAKAADQVPAADSSGSRGK